MPIEVKYEELLARATKHAVQSIKAGKFDLVITKNPFVNTFDIINNGILQLWEAALSFSAQMLKTVENRTASSPEEWNILLNTVCEGFDDFQNAFAKNNKGELLESLKKIVVPPLEFLTKKRDLGLMKEDEIEIKIERKMVEDFVKGSFKKKEESK